MRNPLLPDGEPPLARRVTLADQPLVIQPYELVRLELGTFPKNAKRPRLTMRSATDLAEAINYYDVALRHGRGYRLSRTILSFWDKPVTITVKLH